MKPIIQASAPGSLMLLGEHAVVRGSLGVAVSLQARVYVSLKARDDNKVLIQSDRFGSFQTTLAHLMSDNDAHAYTLGTLRYFQPILHHGYDIGIHSELSPTHSFGSSAALVVALVSALQQACQLTKNAYDIAAIARTIIIDVQGMGSGCDAYASALGGTVAIRRDEKNHVKAQRFDILPPLTAIYTGYKTKTAIVLAHIAEKEEKNPSYYADLFNQIHIQSQTGLDYLQDKNWQALGEIMRAQFTLQQALGTSDNTSDSIMNVLDDLHDKTGQPWGAKISGSGLGDCLIALGNVPDAIFPTPAWPNTAQCPLVLGSGGVI